MAVFSSRVLESAVEELSRLPGIGRRTALRLSLHLLKQEPADVEALGNAIIRLRTNTRYCRSCYNISDTEYCHICSDPGRNKGILCVVEDLRDVMAIENTGQYHGLYHVLGGVISPMEGIGPDDLNIQPLLSRLTAGDISEIIMALPATIEGDTSCFYIFRQIGDPNIKVTTIARGISIGDDLEYADEATLGRSIINRTIYEDSLNR